ncbi:MAG: hypothetical protein IRZ29_09770, partial [Thermoflavifilum sp.]|nr:hypothetical protein [Thermoflavifilum sp.]
VYFRYVTPYQISIQHGVLQSIVQRGYVFKTYEGQLALPGRNDSVPLILHFSVVRPSLADSLISVIGNEVTLKLLTYKGRLPWRGESATIADALLYVSVPDSVRQREPEGQ